MFFFDKKPYSQVLVYESIGSPSRVGVQDWAGTGISAAINAAGTITGGKYYLRKIPKSLEPRHASW